MARNQEKAQLMFNRWTTMKSEIAKGGKGSDRRPYLASECKVISEAEKWRRQIIGELTRKVAEIQNAGLGESRVRDLNDEINKLLREKYHWERQIKALGGADYIASAPRSYDADGRELPGQRGYRYFGAAKDLPGVKELFDSGAQEEASQRSRAAIMRDITPDYYGYRDDDDGVLAAAEAAAERDALVAAREEWDASVAARAAQRADRGAAAGGSADDADDDEGLSLSAAEALAFADTAFRAHVPVPTQADIERALLARKKELLQASLAARYGAGGASSGSAAEGGTV